MQYVLDQLGRFWWWVQQGSNSNIILVLITGVYVWLTFRMLRWSAAAIRIQMNEQRAWVFVSLLASASEIVSKFIPSPTQLEILYVNPVFRNYGKTIAKITLAKAKFLALPNGQRLPNEPDYGGPEFNTVAVTSLLPPDNPAQGLQPGISSLDFLPVYERKATLWLYGFVDYYDANGVGHQTRFCFEYRVPAGFNPNAESFFLSGPEAYTHCT